MIDLLSLIGNSRVGSEIYFYEEGWNMFYLVFVFLIHFILFISRFKSKIHLSRLLLRTFQNSWIFLLISISDMGTSVKISVSTWTPQRSQTVFTSQRLRHRGERVVFLAGRLAKIFFSSSVSTPAPSGCRRTTWRCRGTPSRNLTSDLTWPVSPWNLLVDLIYCFC